MAKADRLFSDMGKLMHLKYQLGMYAQQELDALSLKSKTHHLLPLIQARIKALNEDIDRIWTYWFIDN